MKILMHMCCSNCADYPINYFKENHIEADVLYYEKCIHEDERADNHENDIKILSEKYHVNVFIYPKVSTNLLDDQEICLDDIRIKKTFELGKELGYDAVTTSLLVSPGLDHEKIVEIGLKYSEFFQIPFFYKDFI